MNNEQRLLFVSKRYEEKLKELMRPDEFDKFAKQVAREMLRPEVEGMEESDFKDFILGNFEEITK